MIPQKYTEDVGRCRTLGKYIKDRVGEVFGSQREAGDRFAELTGLKNIGNTPLLDTNFTSQ